MTSSFLTNLST